MTRFLAMTSLALMLVATIEPRRAHASCGLEICPLPEDDSSQASAPGFRLSQTTRLTAYSFDGNSGRYAESILGIGYVTRSELHIGAIVPLIALFADEDMTLGLGNAAGFVDFGHRLSDAVLLRVGSQIEAPTGTSSAVASEHFEVLPYGGVLLETGRLRFQSEIGARLSLGGGHSHDDGPHAVLAVNPHSNRELVYQATVDFAATTRVRPGATVRGQQVLEDAMDHFASAGVQLAWHPADRWMIRAGVELPIVRPARFDSRAGIQAIATF